MRSVFAAGVMLAHVGLVAFFPCGVLSGNITGTDRSQDALQASIIRPVSSNEQMDTVPLPDVELSVPRVDSGSLTAVRFEDLDDDAQIVGSTSAPRLSRVQSVSQEIFARKAGLLPRHPAVVVLAILVSENGSVEEATVTRGSGNPQADAAAVQYAQALRWIPGTKNQQPRAMRIVFPVVLSVAEG